jgi:hypothetical protein
LDVLLNATADPSADHTAGPEKPLPGPVPAAFTLTSSTSHGVGAGSHAVVPTTNNDAAAPIPNRFHPI